MARKTGSRVHAKEKPSGTLGGAGGTAEETHLRDIFSTCRSLRDCHDYIARDYVSLHRRPVDDEGFAMALQWWHEFPGVSRFVKAMQDEDEEELYHHTKSLLAATHIEAVAVLMAEAERLGLDSRSIYPCGQWCRRLTEAVPTLANYSLIWPTYALEGRGQELDKEELRTIDAGQAVIEQLRLRRGNTNGAKSDPMPELGTLDTTDFAILRVLKSMKGICLIGSAIEIEVLRLKIPGIGVSQRRLHPRLRVLMDKGLVSHPKPRSGYMITAKGIEFMSSYGI